MLAEFERGLNLEDEDPAAACDAYKEAHGGLTKTAHSVVRRRPVRSGPDRAGRTPPAGTRGPATRRSTRERA